MTRASSGLRRRPGSVLRSVGCRSHSGARGLRYTDQNLRSVCLRGARG